MFRTLYDGKRVRTFSNHGERFKTLYNAKVDEKGSITLEPNGVMDRYAFVQADKESADINNIIQRFVNGDVSVMNQRPAQFGDFTDFPKTYAEALQKVIDAENMFNTLPLSVRESYNHNPAEFIADIGSEKWMKAVGIEKKEPTVEPTAEPTVEPVKGGAVVE